MKKIAEGTATDGSKFNLYLDESQPDRPKPEDIWDDVTEAELVAFLDKRLTFREDLFMEWYSWNDFSRGKWPQSMVAMAYRGRDKSDPDRFRILKELRQDLTNVK